MFRESSMVLLRDNNFIVDVQVGNQAKVEFDFDKIWKAYQTITNTKKGLDFYHVHPKGMLELSETDKNCMGGYRLAFDEDFIFHFTVISFFIEYEPFNYDCVLRTYTFDDNNFIIDLKDYVQPIEDYHLLMLKHLSYSS